MRIVLFDLKTDGHHLQFVNYLVRYFRNKGDKIAFVTWNYNDHIENLTDQSSQFNVNYVDPGFTREFGGNLLRRSRHIYKGIRYCFKFANSWNADIVQFMYIDRSEIPLTLHFLKNHQINSRIFALLVTPYFLNSAEISNLNLKQLYHNVNKTLLKKLLAFNKLQNLFVLSEKTRRILLKEWPDIPPDKVINIPDPIEPFYDYCSKEKAREIINLPKNGKILLYFGGLRWDKGPDIFLKAIPHVQEECWWVIAGQPSNISVDKVNKLIDKLDNPEGLITRLEFIPDEDVKYYYLSADAVVLPYRSAYKGTSGILQHAAAAGRPVIATDAGQIGDIVRNWELGAVVPPDSPSELAKGVKSFLEHKNTIENFKEKARHYAEEHHWIKMCKIIRESYINALQG